MKRFFTFLMAVWALLSISQTVKAADYCIMSSFVEGQDVGSSSSTETGAKYYLVGSMNNWDGTDYPSQQLIMLLILVLFLVKAVSCILNQEVQQTKLG